MFALRPRVTKRRVTDRKHLKFRSALVAILYYSLLKNLSNEDQLVAKLKEISRRKWQTYTGKQCTSKLRHLILYVFSTGGRIYFS